MHEIEATEITPEVKALFRRDAPTIIRAFAVMAGGNMGRIFVDDAAPPRHAFVWEADDGTLYRGGTYDRPIGCSDLSPGLGKPPTGYEVHRMDEALWKRSPKRDEDHGRYGSMRNFLERGIACCITHGDETVCEAYADMDIDGTREIGIATQEAHRGRGLATIACAHLIRWCEQAGSAAYWDCAALNAGSRALARRLGFQDERAYRLLAWFGPEFKTKEQMAEEAGGNAGGKRA